jgi:hypothetical protein
LFACINQLAVICFLSLNSQISLGSISQQFIQLYIYIYTCKHLLVKNKIQGFFFNLFRFIVHVPMFMRTNKLSLHCNIIY